jgi:UV DNA damage endonuclease
MFLFLLSPLHSSRTAPFIPRSISCRKLYGFQNPQLYIQARCQKVYFTMPPKRKRSSVATIVALPDLPSLSHEMPIPPPPVASIKHPASKRQASNRNKIETNPNHNTEILDGKTSLRASPDAETATPSKQKKKTPTKSSIAAKKGLDEIKAFKAEQAAKKSAEIKVQKEDCEDEWDKRQDPDGDDAALLEDVDAMKKEAGRPPPVNSDYLPLPWKGRLGYVGAALSGEFY